MAVQQSSTANPWQSRQSKSRQYAHIITEGKISEIRDDFFFSAEIFPYYMYEEYGRISMISLVYCVYSNAGMIAGNAGLPDDCLDCTIDIY